MNESPLHTSLDFERVVVVGYNRSKKGLVVEPDSVRVSRARGERVRWVTSIPKGRIGIAWKGGENPFSEPVVSGGEQAISGLPHDGAEKHAKAPGIRPAGTKDTPHCHYDYTITVTVGRKKLTLDPDVDIYP
jgi:hypothetical protein